MPWCPNCRNEYKNGIGLCTECNIPLVEELPAALSVLCSLEKEEAAQKLADFLEFEGIGTVELYLSEENGFYEVHIPAEEMKEAKKLYAAFLDAETPEDEKDAAVRERKAAAANSRIYVKKEDRYKDFKSSAWTFLFFGILGLAFVAANAFGLIGFLSGWFSLGIAAAMFTAFLIISVYSFRKAKSFHGEIAVENTLTERAAKWLEENITEDILEAVADESQSPEANDMIKLERIKELLLGQFEEMDDAYADQLTEEFYQKNY